MLVHSVMSAPVETVDAASTCAEVRAFFEERGLRRAPVVDDGGLAGMVTERDLQAVAPRTVEELEQGERHPFFRTPVRRVASTRVLAVAPTDPVQLAAGVMLRAKIGSLPVVDSSSGRHEVVGILTESDIFRLFVRRTLTQRGHRLILRAPAGSMRDLDPAAICVAARAQLFDLGLYPHEGGRVSVVLQVRTDDEERLVDRFLAAGYEFILVERS